jgi:hypothetical protein
VYELWRQLRSTPVEQEIPQEILDRLAAGGAR